MTKDLAFKIRLEEKDRARLDAVAAHHEVSAAALIRLLLKQEAERLSLADYAKPSKR